MNQAERKFALSIFVKVGTALSADWMRPLALSPAYCGSQMKSISAAARKS
jgi:hypothetical protein